MLGKHFEITGFIKNKIIIYGYGMMNEFVAILVSMAIVWHKSELF